MEGQKIDAGRRSRDTVGGAAATEVDLSRYSHSATLPALLSVGDTDLGLRSWPPMDSRGGDMADEATPTSSVDLLAQHPLVQDDSISTPFDCRINRRIHSPETCLGILLDPMVHTDSDPLAAP